SWCRSNTAVAEALNAPSVSFADPRTFDPATGGLRPSTPVSRSSVPTSTHLCPIPRQAQARPLARHLGHHLGVHAEFLAPLALGLRRPFVGGVEADLRTQAALRRGEVEIVDGGVLDEGD